MLRSRKRKAEEKARAEAIAQLEARKKKLSRLIMRRTIGASIISACVLILATKKLIDEVFVGDDWSDVDWGEEEDFGVDID